MRDQHQSLLVARAITGSSWLLDAPNAITVVVPPQPLLVPRVLQPDQRHILRSFAERDGSERNAAIFALGFWAESRVSDIACLGMDDADMALTLN